MNGSAGGSARRTEPTAGDPTREPRLVVVCGVPGVGKTTVAERVAGRVDADLVRTDVVRKDLRPEPEYTDEETSLVYRTVFERARDALARGDSVVLDGTFRERSLRDRALAVAEETGTDLTVVKVECEEGVVERRIRNREDDESDADFAVYTQLRDAFEPVERDHVTVDNSGDLAATYRQVDAAF